MENRNQLIFLIILITLLFIINYSFLDNLLINFFDESETGFVERVIDGDTAVINGESVRLLGINSPERGEKYYDEAKEYLEELILNKSVKLKYGKDKRDIYDRILAYIFMDNKNMNLGLVKNGFANFYFPFEKDVYYNDFKKAWEKCIKGNKNLCEKSTDKCSNCIKLKEFDYKNEIITLGNVCMFECDLNKWGIKDEGRKNFVFPDVNLKSKKEIKIKVGKGKNSESIIYWVRSSYVWTKTGDTLFLRDSAGKLVLWENY
jgi:micrococcal nuclease